VSALKYDAIIAGAGPSGLIAAHRIARDGHRVLVLEEHSQVGIPDHCAGLISSSGIKKLGLVPPPDVIQNTVEAARIYSPSGHSLLVERGKREALVINRRRFDAWLASRTMEAGAELKTSSKVTDVTKLEDGSYRVNYTSNDHVEEVIARVVLNAEGSRGVIAHSLGFPRIPRSSKYPAFQYEVSGISIDKSIVEMFYGRNVSNGFFAWIIPLGGDRARVGIASKDRAKQRLQSCMKNHPVMHDRLTGMKIDRSLGGVVIVGPPLRKTADGGAVSLGDAAGFVKATTGGGIILGGTSANIAGARISRELSHTKGEIDLSFLNALWRTSLQRELWIMYIAQRILMSFSDKGLDELVKGASRTGILDIIRREGDMDLQRRVILRLLRSPEMFLVGLRAIRYWNPLF
jgi:digeranylgeranylglycerophospholipid reductase